MSMATETADKRLSGTGFLIALGILVVVNLAVGMFFAPRHVVLQHAPVVQLPNFLHVLGVPGEWMPAHVTFTWLVMAILVVMGVLGPARSAPSPARSRTSRRW